MKHQYKKLPGSIIDLEVLLDQQEFQSYWQTAYDHALSQVELKGFRRGAAPKELADRAVDKEKVFEEAANEAVRKSLKEVSTEHNWTIIDKPQVEITETSPLMPDNKENQKAGLKYKARLAVFPEIELGNYKKIAKKVFSEKQAIEVAPEEIEKTLDWLRNSRAKLTRVSRAAKTGDLVEADVSSSLQGKPIKGGELKGDRFILGESRFVPGFDEKIAEHREGESVSFSLTAPSDYWQKDLRGKQIDFQARINGVFERELPELNSDFAKSLGPNFETLEMLKENIGRGIKMEKEEGEKERLRVKIIDEIVKGSKIDPPQIMIDKTLESMVAEVKQIMKGEGQNRFSDQELKTQLKERARQKVLANLVMHKIAEVEKLEPLPEEIKTETAKHNLDLETHYDYIYGIVRNRKLFEFLEKKQ